MHNANLVSNRNYSDNFASLRCCLPIHSIIWWRYQY